MSKVNFELKGADKLINKLKKYGAKAEIEVDAITQAAVLDMVADAKRLAPKDTGKLAQNIFSGKIGDLAYRFYATMKYAPYMEFGTGGLVSVPDELRTLAIQFKGAGVKKINLMPQPFMYPSYIINKQYYIEDLEKMLKRYGKDITR